MILDFGLGIDDLGFLIADLGFWILDLGFWIGGCLWFQDYGVGELADFFNFDGEGIARFEP